ncbi:MAG: amidase [Geminicoccaceae bacterium]|nr:MAG: amidase [Geminicoccaceae bacterium]
MATEHHLNATPETVFWGYFDAATPPVLRVASGDVVTIEALPAGDLDDLPADASLVLPEHRPVLDAHLAKKGPTAHVMTGPVHVEGAEPGDVLQVDILASAPRQPWGVTKIRPLRGTLPEDFDTFERFHSRIDLDRHTARLPWGKEIPLDPFFGVIATAPPPHWGRIGTNEPRAFGGNMDNKELRAGATLYLPVFTEGALFSVGDGHGCQGDGEVCITALETALTGRFRLTARKDMRIERPFAETADHLISMGFDEDLDDAAKTAVRDMVRLIVERTGLRREEAYVLASLAADFRVTQLVDGNKGIHGLLAKTLL